MAPLFALKLPAQYGQSTSGFARGHEARQRVWLGVAAGLPLQSRKQRSRACLQLQLPHRLEKNPSEQLQPQGSPFHEK